MFLGVENRLWVPKGGTPKEIRMILRTGTYVWNEWTNMNVDNAYLVYRSLYEETRSAQACLANAQRRGRTARKLSPAYLHISPATESSGLVNVVAPYGNFRTMLEWTTLQRQEPLSFLYCPLC